MKPGWYRVKTIFGEIECELLQEGNQYWFDTGYSLLKSASTSYVQIPVPELRMTLNERKNWDKFLDVSIVHELETDEAKRLQLKHDLNSQMMVLQSIMGEYRYNLFKQNKKHIL